MESVRIYEIPDCKMVSSGVGMFGDRNFERFNQWFSALPKTIFPKDYLFWDEKGGKTPGFHWLYLYEEGMKPPEAFRLIDFKGGLYAVITGIDGQNNEKEMAAVKEFVDSHGFVIDDSRPSLGNIITPRSAQAVLGYCQMDYYTPIRAK